MTRATRTWMALPALLLVVACGGGQVARAPEVPESPEVAACRNEAASGTAAVDFGRRHVPSNPAQMDRLEAQRQVDEQRSFRDCLRRRGLVRGGGVEAVRQPSLF